MGVQNEVTPEGANGEAISQTTETAPSMKPTASGPRVQTIPTDAIGRMKKEARERGKREAMNDLETQAKAAGFGSLAEAFQALKAVNAPVANASNGVEGSTRAEGNGKNGKGKNHNQHRQDTRGNGSEQRNDEKWQREIQKRDQALQETQRKLRLEERKRKEAQRMSNQREVEYAIREQAIASGVQDVDFAVELVRRKTRQIVDSTPAEKLEEALRQFDEKKFFEGLRAEKPYLFGERVVPATTGTGGDHATAPSAPSPRRVIDANAKGDQVDARKMSREEFNEKLAAMGLNPTA